MFTFIKKVQELLDKLKKNKGLWFTTLSVLSIIGIMVFMYIVVTMTDRVSKKVYTNMLGAYELRLDAKIENKRDDFKKLSTLLQQNELLITSLQKNDVVSLDTITNNLNKKFIESGFTTLTVNVISTINNEKTLRNAVNTAVNTKREIFGPEVLEDGVFLVSLTPLQKEGAVYGVLEIRESIHSFRTVLNREGSEYVFVLNKKMFSLISLEQKTNQYQDINNEFTLKKVAYGTKFATTLLTIDVDIFQEFLHARYMVDDQYFRIAKKINDINGVEIGIIISGEEIDESGSFVTIASEMTNSITTAALGLIISIILFLF